MSGKPRRSDSSESAGQDNLFSHLEPQRLDYLLNTLNAGAAVLGRFLTLPTAAAAGFSGYVGGNPLR